MGINVKLEVHMSSVWQAGNGAAEASANPFLLTVFHWLMQLSHTRAQMLLQELLPGLFLVC